MSNDDALTIDVDLSLFRVSAIKKAAYRLSSRGDFQITASEPGHVSVKIEKLGDDESVDALAADFRRHLLDQELREEIAEQTTPIANLLLAQAFSATSLIDPHCDSDDFRDDPLRTSIPDSNK